MSFSSSINSKTTDEPPLPFTHITDVEGFVRILPTGEISSTQECPVFQEHLVYAFYGRPSYRVNSDNLNTYTSSSYAPVCFVLKPDTPVIKRVHPFDTGGFDYYKNYLHHSQQLTDFELEPNIQVPQKMVGYFYGSNQKYFDLLPLRDLSFDATETALQNYYELITSTGVDGIDDRSSSIEIQFDDKIDLTDRVLAVVLPYTLLDNSDVADCLTAWHAYPLPYKVTGRYRPIEFGAVFRERLEDFFRQFGYL